MRLVVLAIAIAATAAAVTTAKGGDARGRPPLPHETAGLAAGEGPAPSAATGGAARYHPYAQCRRQRGYPPATRTPSKRELTACRKQLARDAQKDTHVAIRVTFNEADWPAAICIVDHEGGRWNRAAPMGAAGEITSWQWHPGWWKPGHTFNGGPPVLDEQKLRESALYATRAARRLWERSGGSFRVHWVNSSRKCGL